MSPIAEIGLKTRFCNWRWTTVNITEVQHEGFKLKFFHCWSASLLGNPQMVVSSSLKSRLIVASKTQKLKGYEARMSCICRKVDIENIRWFLKLTSWKALKSITWSATYLPSVELRLAESTVNLSYACLPKVTNKSAHCKHSRPRIFQIHNYRHIISRLLIGDFASFPFFSKPYGLSHRTENYDIKEYKSPHS